MPRSKDGRWTARCEVCGSEYQQRRAAQRVCSIECRAQLPRDTGGVRVKAGLPTRQCQNLACGKNYQPVRENQIACTRACLLKCPSYIEAQRRTDMRPERQAVKNARRRLDGAVDLEERRFVNLRANMSRVGIRFTREMYKDWLARQDGYCKICGNPAEGKDGHTDHDHTTHKLRDLLCGNCNLGVGQFKDDPILLRKAAEYIERHRAMAEVT